ncbi:MAG TPA: O-antigen ligase family protein [Lautropia sp.]|nr:O-antigen ligase family protein [Lautropia sp.]
MSFSAVKLAAGPLPLRVLTLFAAGMVLAVSDPAQMLASIRRFWRLLLVVTLAAVLASIVSIAAGTPGATLVTQLIEIHFQAIIGVMVAGTLALRLGVRAVTVALLIGFAITGIVAIAQALGVDPAWQARAFMGALTNDPPITRMPYETRERAMGMSFSPVVFATQACLILALLLALRLARPDEGKRFDWWVLAFCLIIAIFCLATGNRSPLLGIAIFLGTYLAFTKPRASLVLVPAFLALALVAEPIIENVQETGVRAVKADSSSENRGTLRQFGILLLLDRPIGYGLDFNSTRYAEAHISALKYESSPYAIRLWTLHNYYLMALCKYGLFILLLIPFVMPRSGRQLRAWWAFVPYMVHIFYHNDGPLQGDFIIFFILPLTMLLSADTEAPPRRRRVRKGSLEPAAA